MISGEKKKNVRWYLFIYFFREQWIIEEKKNEDQNILASKQSIEKDTEVKNILKEFNGELIENTIKPNSD